jgi:hypothetical protein
MHAHRTCSQDTSSSRAAWGLHSVGVTLLVPAARLVHGCLAALLTCHSLTAGLCGSRLEVAVRHWPAFKVYVYTHCRSLTELALVCSALIARCTPDGHVCCLVCIVGLHCAAVLTTKKHPGLGASC